MQAWWDVESFRDHESGVAFYSACLGSAPFLCDIYEMRQVAVQDSPHVVFELNRTAHHGEIFCTSVEATNVLGHVSDRASSDCLVVDTSPPEMIFAGSGVEHGVHMDGVAMKTSFLGNAAAFDNETEARQMPDYAHTDAVPPRSTS